MQSKILNAAIVCAGNPSHCERLGVLRRLCIRVLVLELPTQLFQALFSVDFAMLTRDYGECSRYSRSSVGTPELKDVKHVY